MAARPPRGPLSYSATEMASDVVAAADFVCLVALALTASGFGPDAALSLAANQNTELTFSHAALIAAVLGPLILYDARLGEEAARGPKRLWLRPFVVRFALLSAVLFALGTGSQMLRGVPLVWLGNWWLLAGALTAAIRLTVLAGVRLLQRHGMLTEVIAVVGAGPRADRLVAALLGERPAAVELLGVFDDKTRKASPSIIPALGNLEELIECGKTHRIDWILLTLPPTAEHRIHAIVARLRALAVPIGLCPPETGLTMPYRAVDFIAGAVPISLLAGRPRGRWHALLEGSRRYLPHWLLHLVELGAFALVTLLRRQLIGNQSARGAHRAGSSGASMGAGSDTVSAAGRASAPRNRESASGESASGKSSSGESSSGESSSGESSSGESSSSIGLHLEFDDLDLAQFTRTATEFGAERYGYAVTPNADHIIRLNDDAAFRQFYSSASFVLLDSRFLARLLRVTRGLRLPVCTGSDLTAALFTKVIRPHDRIVLIGSSREQAERLVSYFGPRNLVHFNPAMGFIRDPEALETCLRFIEMHSPFRFCILAVGAPQQEMLARRLQERGVARGLALCVGASIDFLTGRERRAPLWMQEFGLEWAFRLIRAPRRMGHRYLIRGPRVFWLLCRAQILLRTPRAAQASGASL
jgi:exopolysaccharide biosynthesis WecB/TagA/CpsF family protein